MNLQQSLHKIRHHINLGEIDSAEAMTQRLRRKKPGHHEVQFLEGCIQYQKGNYGAAIQRFRKLLARQPRNLDVRMNLAVALLGNNEADEAATLLQEVTARQPDNHLAWYNLGNAWRVLGRNEAARDAYLKVLARVPAHAPACNNLSVVCRLLGDHQQAVAFGRRAVALQSDAVFYVNLIIALMACDLPAAYQAAREALEKAPAPILEVLCFPLLVSCCDWQRSGMLLPRLQAAVHDGKVPLGIVQDMLLSLNACSGIAPEVVFDLHRCWGEGASSGAAPPVAEPPPRHGPLHIGYVSGDFGGHSVGLFIEAVLAAHDPAAFRIHCYASSAAEGEINRRIRQSAYVYRDVSGLSDEAFADQVRRDGIHILVDLSGHTRNSRLSAFVRRPAPLQMTWLGYPNTTGLPAVDYRISDAHAEAQGGSLYSEQLLLMPESFLCFGAFQERPRQARPPLLDSGQVTFGSFNDTRKLNPDVIRVWSAILRETPGSRLVIKARLAGEAVVGENIHREFARHGIEAARVELRGFTASRESHLDSYREIDIALDTFPYNGTTTTCEALWMGVPVVTLVGRTHAQRVSYSILRNIGVEETVADTEAAYIQQALALAADPRRLERLRCRIPEAIRASILCDPQRFTRQLEDLFRQAWEARQGDGAAPASLLEAHGYGLFRALPEDGVHVPWQGQPPSAAAGVVLLGPARREALQAQGRLLPQMPGAIQPPALETGAWVEILDGPYVHHCRDAWLAYLQRHGDSAPWLLHQQALDCHAFALRSSDPVSGFLARLYGYRILFQLLQHHATLGNLQTFARLALAVGEDENCRLALAQIEQLLQAGEPDLSEPFLPVAPSYDGVPISGAPREWLQAAIHEARRSLPAAPRPPSAPVAASRPRPRPVAARRIRVLHNLARSGGTLVAKCLGCMDGVVLLSEIHPKASERFNPLQQAQQWFRLFEAGELEEIQGRGRLNFVEQMDLIEARCHELGKVLVVRDWSHYDFTAVPFASDPSYRFTTAEVLELSGRFSLLRHAIVRHPIDQWLSLSRLSMIRERLGLAEFLEGYLRYAEACRETGFLRYEDFTAAPARCLEHLCELLEIPYDGGFLEKWQHYETITGEVHATRAGSEIRQVARRPVDDALLQSFAANRHYRAALELLGYGHPQ